MKLSQLLETGRNIRVAGFDDTHYDKSSAEAKLQVNFSGIVCASTRFEGMLWGTLTKDGFDATDRIADLVGASKFKAQLHLVLLDGITFGGCNLANLAELSNRLGLPCVAVMRRMPDLEAFRHVVSKLPDPDRRQLMVDAAGPIYHEGRWFFQVAGEQPQTIAQALDRLTDQGNVPEALRLAHLIGSAIMFGESSNRA